MFLFQIPKVKTWSKIIKWKILEVINHFHFYVILIVLRAIPGHELSRYLVYTLPAPESGLSDTLW